MELVLHPERNQAFQHFADAHSFPFDSAASRAHRRNAWWLGEAAFLTYWDAASVTRKWSVAGFRATVLDHQDVQCDIAANDTVAIVAFRGTQPDRWQDILDDALAVFVPWARPGTFVHAGFKRALERIWPQLEPELRAVAPRSVWFAGHSLGAALATLSADRWPATAGIVTIGSPRVGDKRFTADFDARFGDRSVRYANNTDIVTRVPIPLIIPPTHDHVGQFRHILPDGQVTADRPRLDRFVTDLFGATGPVLDMVEAARESRQRPPRFLLDHMPELYAVDMWNDFALNGD